MKLFQINLHKLLLFISILYLFSYDISYSKNIKFSGLSKLNPSDIQTLSIVDIFSDNLSDNEISILIKELNNSDLIYDISLIEDENSYYLKLTESKIINNIYINGNIRLEDDLILENLNSRNEYLLIKNSLDKDLKIISAIYKSQGFNEVSVNSSIESFSNDRVNLIFTINEGRPQKIATIKFYGNNTLSTKYLKNVISSDSISTFNIFSKGSNFNEELFKSDISLLENEYSNRGFFNAKISYLLENNAFNLKTLKFYIEEGDRIKINQLKFNLSSSNENLLSDLTKKLINDLDDNENYYDFDLISNFIEKSNEKFAQNNQLNLILDFSIIANDKNIDIVFKQSQRELFILNNIDIYGNSITKDKTIRSKLEFEPGDYYDQNKIDKSLKKIARLPYIDSINDNVNFNEDTADINISIEENIKTGNLLLAGSFNADVGVGVNFGVEDTNVFGSGNRIKSNFSINSEDLKFDINYISYPLFNPNISNSFSLYNQENDYTGSFGYKATRYGLGYSLNFNYNEFTKISSGISYENFKGHSSTDNSVTAITDNILTFDNYTLKLGINYDTLNDIFYPTNGHQLNLSFLISPEGISDNDYYKIILNNKNYFGFKNSNNFIFIDNNYGYAHSPNSKIKTKDAFSLGGLNFKGFDYRGVGPLSNNIYLGGNQYFTSTLGYGSSFLFDDKDNINIKLFTTIGSIWDSDYASVSSANIRSSAGLAFDILTPVGPISFNYAVPLKKYQNDKTRSFTLSIGTSF